MLKDKAKNLKEIPGVYLMKDSSDLVIYVGKSKNLKSRVSSYFGNRNNRSSKVEKLIKNIKDFEYIYTDTELEALLLEKDMIDRYKPTYNRLLKNVERYPYVCVTLNEDYPKVITTYEKIEDKNIYFGPFTNHNLAVDAVNSINYVLKLRTCNIIPKSSCLHYNLKNCLGICIREDLKTIYNEKIRILINYLSLKDEKLLKIIEDEMNESALNLDFEKAIMCREKIKSISYLKREIENLNRYKNVKLLVVEILKDKKIKLFCIYNSILYSEVLNLNDINIDFLSKVIMSVFNKENDFQYEIDKIEIDNVLIINNYLKSNKVKILKIENKSENEINKFLRNIKSE